MINDEVLKDFIAKCPGLQRSTHEKYGAFDMLSDLAGGILLEEIKDNFNLGFNEYNFPIPVDVYEDISKLFTICDTETIYYVAYRTIGIEMRRAYFAITTDKLCFTGKKQGNYAHIPWGNIKHVWRDGIESNDGRVFEIMLNEIAETDKFWTLNDKFINWLNNLVNAIQLQRQQEHERYNVDNIESLDQLLMVCRQWREMLSDIKDEEGQEEFLGDLAMKCNDFCEEAGEDEDEKESSGQDLSVLQELNEYRKEMCETYLQRFPDGLLIPWVYWTKSDIIWDETDDVISGYESVRCLSASINRASNCPGWDRVYNDQYNILRARAKWVAANFLSMPPQKRQFLVIDDSLSYLESNIIFVLPQELPETIHFPMGHPQEHVLYIKHPFIDDYYIPYETCEFELFKDKMDELRRVLQAMGATRITISDTKSLENSTNRKSHTNIDTNINAKINSLKGNADLTRDESSYESLLNEYGTESTYGPTKKPYIPDGLVWYPNESSWQRLFEERKDGLLHHKLRISSKSSSSLTKIQEMKLKADFKALILHIDASLEHEATETFEQNASATWELEIDFAPLEQLTDNSGNMAASTIQGSIHPDDSCQTADETAYLEEVKFCLEDDGQIDEKERRLLERIRIKYNIDKSRAEELERTLIQGTAEEEEFRTAVREYLEDGELTEKDNALLARLANRLGITPERAEELKKQVADE